ncbi:hypothetical protein LGV61_04995 [Desulfurispirillum indicum]|uniref:hypothetical protein n=1 Tax=Desulfurispirillum indicum TaxID=936456 RepID=UPI001CFA89F5|nr:hypothetical protein [Desulfurispirillum indicum]UCZ57637.1 hypothetical protein LGV61_04995 [Desulfurispirillum indicum]
MIKLFSIFILIVFFSFSVNSKQPDAIEIYSGFIDSINDESFIEFRDNIIPLLEECSWGNGPYSTILFPVELNSKLYRQVSMGSVAAFHAGLIIMKCLDGGERGDFKRSGGLFFEKHPEIFFRLSIEEDVSLDELTHMLINFPLELADDIHAQIAALQNRIMILDDVDMDEYSMIIEACRNSMINKLEFLFRIQLEFLPED